MLFPFRRPVRVQEGPRVLRHRRGVLRGGVRPAARRLRQGHHGLGLHQGERQGSLHAGIEEVVCKGSLVAQK